MNGKIFKRHEGLSSFTIGQRKGMGISWDEPLYVVELDYKSSTVIVGERKHLEKKGAVRVSRFNMLSEFSEKISASVRYNQRPVDVQNVEKLSDTEYAFTFAESIDSVAPGQMLVAYSGDRVIGGGIIEG